MKDGAGKIYVVDTSVLVHDPQSLERLGKDPDNEIVIPIVVIEELDRLKGQNGKGEAAREVSRRLDEYRSRGPLHAGVATDGGGRIRLEMRGKSLKKLPPGLSEQNDNIILSITILLTELEEKKSSRDRRKVILVTKDINLRLKADACKVFAEDYKSDKVAGYVDRVFHGIVPIPFREERTDLLQVLYTQTRLPLELIKRDVKLDREPTTNECCNLVLPSGKYAQAIFKKDPEPHFVPVPKIVDWKDHTIMPRNPEQAFALALMLDPTIPLVSLVGKAGTGKTLLALYAAYSQMKKYDSILVFRPYIEVGRKLGFLPGDAREKFEPYMEPIYDQMSLILANAQHTKGEEKSGPGERRKGHHATIQDMENQGLLKISPITFVRGQTKHNHFIIIDEAQNTTPHEIFTLITRAGEGTKIVLVGDPSQIDDPFLDAASCGLVHTVNRMAGQSLFGHVRLVKSERGELAELAGNLLDPHRKDV